MTIPSITTLMCLDLKSGSLVPGLQAFPVSKDSVYSWERGCWEEDPSGPSRSRQGPAPVPSRCQCLGFSI